MIVVDSNIVAARNLAGLGQVALQKGMAPI